MSSVLENQRRVSDALCRALRADRLGHGLLFSGPRGSGREAAAVGLAAALLCEKHALPFGCRECRACRRVLAGNHPDVQLVLPEAEAVRRGLAQPDGKRKPSPDILVDTVRELAIRLRRPSFEGGARTAIIVDAQRMNDSAQNALLKTLEEPGEGTRLILIVPHERTVLPTIASRCLRLRFAPPVDAGVAANAGADALLAALLEGTAAARLDAAEALGKERGDVDAALAAVEERLGQALRRDVAGGDGVPWRRATVLLERVGATREAVARNASVQLALEQLLLSR